MLHADDCKNNARGDKGLAVAISYYISNGYCIALPLNDSQDYDLIVDGPEGLEKVQVKTTMHKHAANGQYIVGLQSGRKVKVKKMSEYGYHTLFVYTADRDTYILPFHAIKHLNQKLSLGKKYEEYKVESFI